VLAVVCGIAALMLMWKRPATKRTQAVLMVVVGLSVSGWLGSLAQRLLEFGGAAGATTTARVFGVGVPWAFALVVTIWFFLDMDLDGLANRFRKKGGKGSNKHTTTALTPWLGLLTPISLAAVPALAWIPGYIREGVVALSSLLIG